MGNIESRHTHPALATLQEQHWAGAGRDVIITRIRTWHTNQAPLNIPSTQPWYRTIHIYSMMRLWVQYLRNLTFHGCVSGVIATGGVAACPCPDMRSGGCCLDRSSQWLECCFLQSQDTAPHWYHQQTPGQCPALRPTLIRMALSGPRHKICGIIVSNETKLPYQALRMNAGKCWCGCCAAVSGNRGN